MKTRIVAISLLAGWCVGDWSPDVIAGEIDFTDLSKVLLEESVPARMVDAQPEDGIHVDDENAAPSGDVIGVSDVTVSTKPLLERENSTRKNLEEARRLFGEGVFDSPKQQRRAAPPPTQEELDLAQAMGFVP